MGPGELRRAGPVPVHPSASGQDWGRERLLAPPTLRAYRRAWLGADALAALTLVAVALPSQMATARLADLPAVVGLYAFLAGSLLYAALGTKPHLSVGADSTIAPVLATAATAVAAAGSAGYAATMAFMALLVGGLLIVVGLLRLGWISDFLSTPGDHRGPGRDRRRDRGPPATGHLGGEAAEARPRSAGCACSPVRSATPTAGASASRSASWPWSSSLNGSTTAYQGALVGLVLSIIAVDALGLASHHGVAVIGAVHGGLPHISLPSAPWSQLRLLVAPVLTVAFVCIAQTAATVRESSAEVAAADDFNRDLIGVGAGSRRRRVSWGLSRWTPAPRTPPLCRRRAPARSSPTSWPPWSSWWWCWWPPGPSAHLPQATLGATLVFIATKLFRAGQLRTVLRFDRLEFALAVSTLVVVAFVGIEQGVALAMVLSLADRTRRSARPQRRGPRARARHRPLDPGRHRPHDRGGARDPGLPGVRPAVVRQRRLLPFPGPPARQCCALPRARRGPRRRWHVRHRLHRAAGLGGPGGRAPPARRGPGDRPPVAPRPPRPQARRPAPTARSRHLFTSVEAAVEALQRPPS